MKGLRIKMEEEKYLGWYFADNIGGQDYGFENQGINQFMMNPFGRLAREIIQNSYDARKHDGIKVKVNFELMKIARKDIPDLDSLCEAINESAQFYKTNDRLEKFNNAAQEKSKEETIQVLKISDYNTTGLVKIDEKENSAWYGLVRSSGYSPKVGLTGGSYGSGKHAAFVFSCFRTVFYGTFVEKEGYAFQGKTILCSHEHEGKKKADVGYWGNCTSSGCTPIRNVDKVTPLFQRYEEGTDIYIVGAKINEEDTWQSDILYSVIENFWKLIIDDKLEVLIKSENDEQSINSKTVRELANIGKVHNIKIDRKDPFTAYKFIELNDNYPEEIYGSILEENDIVLKIAKMPDYPEKQILKMRNTEMKIRIFSPKKRPVNFIGILMATGEKINKQLRESEPQTHDDWDADNIEDIENKKVVRITINKLNKWLNEQIDKLSYIDDVDNFDAAGLDYLSVDMGEDPTTDDFQKPFDNIENNEVETIEITPSLKSQRNQTESNIKSNIEISGTDGAGQVPQEEGKGYGGGGSHSGGGSSSGGYKELPIYYKTPYDSKHNNYKIILNSEISAEKAEVRFFRWTDSGELEKLKVKKASLSSGTEFSVKDNVVESIKFNAKTSTILNVEFESKRKCVMEVKVYVQD